MSRLWQAAVAAAFVVAASATGFAVGSRALNSRGRTPVPVDRTSPAQMPSSAPASGYFRHRRLVVFGLLLAFGIWLLIQFAGIVMEALILIAVAIVLATALNPLVLTMSRVRLPRGRWTLPKAVTVLFIYLLLALLLAALLLFVVPRALNEAQALVSNIPSYVNQFERWVESLGLAPDLDLTAQQMANQLFGSITAISNFLMASAVDAARVLASTGLVLVMTFFFIMEAERLHGYIISLFPPDSRDRARQVSAQMGHKVTGYLRGVLLLSLFIGTATAIGMWLIGVPYPLLLGLLAGVFELVPMVGAYLGAAPALLVAFTQSTQMLIIVALFFLVLQQLENNVLAPIVVGSSVEISPLLTIIALVLGTAWLGIIGALLAVPTVAVLRVMWTEVVDPQIRSGYGEKHERG